MRSVDHLLAAIAACELDNLLVELSGPEVPAMDGTPRPFMLLLECAGIVEQCRPAPWREVARHGKTPAPWRSRLWRGWR